MDAPFVGMIAIFGFDFEPRNWAFCDGRLLSIAQNTALFSLLGTYYGGDGRSTFALPDLRGRVAVGRGQGPSLSGYSIGQTGGLENVSLTTNQIPAHTHVLNAYSENGNVSSPQGALLANSSSLDPEYRTSGPTVAMGATAIGSAGGNQPHSNVQPYLTVNYCIALTGIFPSRN